MIRRRVRNNPFVRPPWAAFRRRQLHREYQQRRERYRALAEERGLVYDAPAIGRAVRRRLQDRGYQPAVRSIGAIHTFAFIPDIGWHRNLLPDLQELGPLTHFDYVRHGFRVQELYGVATAVARRAELNDKVLPALRAAHQQQPVDWVFVYASGLEISPATIAAITGELGIPTVNMCLDDKQSWSGPKIGDDRTGQIDLAPVFDVSWTSARVACEWYLAEGGRPLYMPEGFDAATFAPRHAVRDIPVSFIGAAYGFRIDVIHHLRRAGIDVRTFGVGWPGSGWTDDLIDVINRSEINLGMGGIGYSETLTNLKGRDFEIPGTGGGLYLTSFNPDLAQHFHIGDEIVCYANREEIIELIRHHLSHPDEGRAIAARARARCLAEHRWRHRYERICRLLGILPETPAPFTHARAEMDAAP